MRHVNSTPAPSLTVAGRRIGLMVGSGRQVDRLLNEFRDLGADFRVYSWSKPFGPRRDYLDLSATNTVIERLISDGVTDVVGAGVFRSVDVVLALITFRGFGFLRILANPEGLFAAFFQPFERALAAAGIRSRTPKDFLPTYAIPQGLITSISSARLDIPAVAAQLRALKPMALRELSDGQPKRRVSQALIYDGMVMIDREHSSTDALLGRVRQLPRTQGGPVRVLMKLCPPSQPATLDPPTIGPRTILNAARAGVLVFGLDAENGLILERERTIGLAEELGVILYGL